MNKRIIDLREILKKQQLDAWIVPTADPHLSEYLPKHWQTRQWLSGFTGSAGTLVVTANEAGLWADSRYWEQAAVQLKNTGIVLHKLGETPDFPDWLAENLPLNARIGIAPDMLSLAAQRRLQAVLARKQQVLVWENDVIDALWQDRPDLPQSTVDVHPAEFVGASVVEKLARVRDAMQQHQAQYHLMSSLDDVAWLTNLRGSDVAHNPVFLSYLLIGLERAWLCVEAQKLSSAAKMQLKEAYIEVVAYDDINRLLAENVEESLLLDPTKVAVSTLQALPSNVRLIEDINPTTLFKSQKSPTEQAHIRQAMVQDGVALCGFFADLEQKLHNHEPLTELDIDALLTQYRRQQTHYVSASFDTIAGFNANGALPHYRATPEAHSVIEGDGLLLIDSGAQYLNGTTDITRVVPVGTPNAAQKRDFTLVLQAHIALATAVFPENIPAPMLDALCRRPMWQAQCDYGHGTGHGVGYFLNVHEPPQTIAYRAVSKPHHAMKEGMLTSNEPGLYRPQQWGIRIENLVLNQKVKQPKEQAFGDFLCFETVTLCPIDTRLVVVEMLSLAERDWLNNYHTQVREKLLPHVDGAAREWLLVRTEAI